MNNKDNKLIVEVYKKAIKNNLDKKKSAKNLTKRLSTILKKYLEWFYSLIPTQSPFSYLIVRAFFYIGDNYGKTNWNGFRRTQRY